MKSMLENIKKNEAEFFSAMEKLDTAHSAVDTILKNNTDDTPMSVEDAFEISINLDIAKNSYLQARKIQANLDGLIECFIKELKKIRTELSNSINQSAIEHRQKMLQEKYDGSGGQRFELAMKRLARDLLDTQISEELADGILDAYGIQLSHGNTIKDALDAAYQETSDNGVIDNE